MGPGGSGGSAGIRTQGGCDTTQHFECCTFGRSDTLPYADTLLHPPLRTQIDRAGWEQGHNPESSHGTRTTSTTSAFRTVENEIK